MQVGQWFGGDRPMRFSEMALQMHVTAAYGSEGFAYFPGCFPLDWAGIESYASAERGGSSLIDIDGNKTIFCDWLKELNGFFAQIEEDILYSSHLGVKTYGSYHNGFTEEEIRNLPDNECIFRGEIPKELQYESELAIESDNEVLVSVFEREGKKRYYFVNLSTVYDSKIAFALQKGPYRMYTAKGQKSISNKASIEMPAGQGVYIVEE